LATAVGYCGLDPRRAPLRGTELRGCWTARADAIPVPDDATPARPDVPPVPVAVARLRPAERTGAMEGFVPVELADRGLRILHPTSRDGMPQVSTASPGSSEPPIRQRDAEMSPAVLDADGWADRDSLFGEL
jgi:hypothetical protein